MSREGFECQQNFCEQSSLVAAHHGSGWMAEGDVYGGGIAMMWR